MTRTLNAVDNDLLGLRGQFNTKFGAWKDDSARNPIVTSGGVNETRGNATVTARYRLVDGYCEWQGHYTWGSTTSWAAGNVALVLPVNSEGLMFATAAASMPGGFLRAYNGSFFPGFVEYNGGGANQGIASCFSMDSSSSITAVSAWHVTATSVPFVWGSGAVVSWNLRYPTL